MNTSARVLADQELVNLIAAISLAWDEIEMSLFRIFDSVLCSDNGTSAAHAVFYSHQNHRARREMLEQLLKSEGSWPPPAERTTLLRICDRVKTAAKARNKLSHGYWLENQNTGDLMRVAHSADMFGALEFSRHLDRKKLRQTLKTIEEVRREVHTASFKISVQAMRRTQARFRALP